MPVTLNDQDGFEIAALTYSRWCNEYDLLKAVKAETDDGEEDWAALHAIRLQNHTAAEAKWKAMVKLFTDQLPRLI